MAQVRLVSTVGLNRRVRRTRHEVMRSSMSQCSTSLCTLLGAVCTYASLQARGRGRQERSRWSHDEAVYCVSRTHTLPPQQRPHVCSRGLHTVSLQHGAWRCPNGSGASDTDVSEGRWVVSARFGVPAVHPNQRAGFR